MLQALFTDSEQSSFWYELVFRKEDFLHIINVLNRYYDMYPPKNHPSDSHRFREDLTKTPVNSIRIFLKKFGDYEFLISAEILESDSKRMDSWIHVDGIKQERHDLENKGVYDHPVFEIVCLTDLYEDSCVKVKNYKKK
ncbi:MAG: hypothetical protein H7A23_17890 [Leptospiraceae bacterium]|nr:hypothetical protein [Leptospiraceae bacterium]MCP5496423.1 hypothetical protein [Leptospiraceae bacterium]